MKGGKQVLDFSILYKVSVPSKEYKGKTDDNSPTGPNTAFRVATLNYYNIYLIEKKDSKVEGSSPSTSPSSRSWPKEEAIPCNTVKLLWNLYRKVRKHE